MTAAGLHSHPADLDGPLVVSLRDGDRSMADLLGGKGANLAEMTRLGLPVPHGFVITTVACRSYLATGSEPASLQAQVQEHLEILERETGRRLGDPATPLLVSVRSGARFSMPGMMETILNVGLTDGSVQGLARRGGERFAWDCYRRLVQMYGRTVLGVDADLFEARLARGRQDTGARDDSELGVGDLVGITADFRRLLVEHSGEELPQDPRAQLDRAIRAVFESWNGERARLYRAHEGIAEDLGTAVNIVEMVYGNTGPDSGSGVCFTRDPATGTPGAYGDYLPNAQGEDVVNGSRATLGLDELGRREPDVHAELTRHLATLERHYRDLCDVEFTVEDSRLWILQTRVGKRSPSAAFRIASDLVDEGVIDLDEALRRVDGGQLESLLHAQFAPGGDAHLVATGLAASPGAAVGELVLDPARAVTAAAGGHTVVLARPETSPDDLAGMLVSAAVITSHGGLTSHAAVVARGMGRACVTGLADLEMDLRERVVRGPDGLVLHEGDVVSVDGTSGEVCRGRRQVRPSPVAVAMGGRTGPPYDATAVAVLRLLAHADRRRRLGVRANAETAHDAGVARRLGAEGIGLARTEHMLLGDRRVLVEHVVTGQDRATALARIEELARDDFTEILEAMDGLPVVVRLLDPPLHEFLPRLVELSTHVAVLEERGAPDPTLEEQLELVRHWHEANPMLGLRGVRLLSVVPELVEAQVRALAEATVALLARGLAPRPEVMVPLVADAEELVRARARIEAAIAEVATARGTRLSMPIGVMVELPRAALTAGRLAETADFFSFGTNDLTQTTWGISRDDAEASFLAEYRRRGLLRHDPFATLDEVGVGRLVELACAEGRAARPRLGLGVCGEHGGDPGSVHFFARTGLDYVSCSPPRVPIARLEAGRAAVLDAATGLAPAARTPADDWRSPA